MIADALKGSRSIEHIVKSVARTGVEAGSEPARRRPHARQARSGSNRRREHATAAPGSRAAKAAARVARRFATAPSYNEMLATEARAAVEAAEAASIAAQEAHAKAQMVLAGIEAASDPEPAQEPLHDSFWEPQAAEVVALCARGCARLLCFDARCHRLNLARAVCHPLGTRPARAPGPTAEGTRAHRHGTSTEDDQVRLSRKDE